MMLGLRWIAVAVGLTLSGASGAQGADLTRCGLELCLLLPPPSCEECKRVKEQIADGCNAGKVAYAPGAAMRGSVGYMDWPKAIRRHTAAAALQSDWLSARDFLDQARTTPDISSTQEAVLVNLLIQMALEFDRQEIAREFLAEAGTASDLPGGLRSDRLFWQALLASDQATPAIWRDEIMPLLDAAMIADERSFQVRVWRMRAWLEAEPWHVDRDCDELGREFANIVLDVTEGRACPLMLAHLWHVTERELQRRPKERLQNSEEVWLSLANGLMAILTGDGPVLEGRRASLADAKPRLACAGVAHRLLSDMEPS